MKTYLEVQMELICKLAMLIFLWCININVFAQTAVEPSGTGTQADPFLITSINNLYWISQTPSSWESYFVQTKDIDASLTASWNEGKGFVPIGSEMFHCFRGNYDGNNHIITSLKIKRIDEYCIGLFGEIDSATIRNLGLKEVEIEGAYRTGGLVGSVLYSTIIENCFTEGTITSGGRFIGGLIGFIGSDVGASSVVNCSYSRCSISIVGNVYRDYSGGLIGYARSVEIENCYFSGGIKGGKDRIGGLVGELRGSDGKIRNCYADAYTEGNTNIGGFIGKNEGLPIENSFWNVDRFGALGIQSGEKNFEATGKTSEELRDIATYTDIKTTGLQESWDFGSDPYDDNGKEDVWEIGDIFTNLGYPYILKQNPYEPKMITEIPSNITENSVTVSGYISSIGGSDIIESGIIYSKENFDPKIESTDATIIKLKPSNKSFSTIVNYNNGEGIIYYRAYAINKKGIGYGDVKFITVPGQPTDNKNLSFDGIDNFLTLAKPLTIGRGNWTIEMWIKVPVEGTNNLGENEDVGIIFSNYNNTRFISLKITNLGKIVYLWNKWTVRVEGTTDLRDNKWHHIALTRDVDNKRTILYLDGIKEVLENSAGEDFDLDTPHMIGKDIRYGESPHFHGEMDEFRIWSKAKTEKEILRDMARSVDPSSKELLLYYRFNEGNNAIVNDLSGNSNYATLSNFAPEECIVKSKAFNTWIGNNSNWNDPINWTGGIPTKDDIVGIYESKNGGCVDIIGDPVVGDLYIDSLANPILRSGITIERKMCMLKNIDLAGQIISLGEHGKLMEKYGKVIGEEGAIEITGNMFDYFYKNTGNIGIDIETIDSLRNITVTRFNKKGGSRGINKQFRISSSTSNNQSACLNIHYDETELLGTNEEELVIYNSNDGKRWREYYHSYVHPKENYVRIIPDNIFGYWTLAPSGCDQDLPIELSSFSASPKNDIIILNWETISEKNNYGYEIERSVFHAFSDNSNNEKGEWSKIGNIQGAGNCNSVSKYSFTDKNPMEGKLSYRLKQIDFDGKYKYSKEIEINYEPVKEYVLEQNYPNPFNPTTTISFGLPQETNVSIKIYNALGEEIAEILNKNLKAGKHSVDFNAKNLSSGTYFCRMKAGKFTKTTKMLLLK